MDVGEIQRFMTAMGCQQISVGARWVRSTCPMQHLHAGGRDRSPSFAISINPGDTSNCRCQACGIYGDLVALVWRMEADGRRTRPELLSYLAKHNQMDVEKLDLDPPEPAPDDIEGQIRAARKYVPPTTKRKSNFVHPDDEPQAEVPEHVLATMIADMPDYVREYLTRPQNPIMGEDGRNLSALTVTEWELGWHKINRRICIPIRDEDGKLVAISGRAFDPHSKPKYLHSRFKRDRVLYGEHRHDATNRTGYLFEGFFQTIFTWQCGYGNTLARMGTHLSRQQMAKLLLWFDHLVIVPDGDKAGRDAAERDRRNLEHAVYDFQTGEASTASKIEQIDIVDMPNKMDADTLKPDDLRGLLGPSNIS